jgi:NhaP-type Na+/H+ or K+/H+ antiporter
MHWHLEIVILAVLLCAAIYSLLTKVIAKTILTLPIIFMAIGYMISHQVNSLAEPESLRDGTRLLAEITLILVLFSDASHVRFSRLKASYKIPARMLLIGLPLTLIFGTLVVAIINPAGGIALALLTAAVLTPTDAALGQTVVSSPDVPERLSQAINVESGLNDGLVLPFVLFGAMMAAPSLGEVQATGLAFSVVLQVVLGPLVGIACGWGLAKAMDFAQGRDLVAEAAGGVVFLSAAFISYVGSEIIGGNGFIAAFVAGMVFGNTYKHTIHFIGEFMEGVGQILTMFAFLVFGALLLPDGIEHISWKPIVVAIMFLTIVRMLPIWLSLLGTGLAQREKFFLGWFGPRGLASILFTLIMTDEFDFTGEAELLACVSMTVFLSIIVHGVSAAPLSKWIGKVT